MTEINNNEDNLWLDLIEREKLLPEKKELTNEEKLLNIQKHVRALVIALCEKEGVIDKDKYINNMTEAVMNTLFIDKNAMYQEIMENDSLDVMNVVRAEQKYVNFFIKKILYKIINESGNLSKEIEEKEKKITEQEKTIEQYNGQIKKQHEHLNSLMNINSNLSDEVNDMEGKCDKLEKVLDSFGEAYIEIGSNGKIEKANKALYAILGCDQLLDCELLDLAFDDIAKEELQDVLNNYDENHNNIITFRHKNDDKVCLQLKVSKSADNSNDLVFLTDVTNFINAINFPMTNPNIVVAFSNNADLIPFKINGYHDDDIFPGFKKILDDLGEKSPEVLFPPDLKQITLQLTNDPESKITKTFFYNKNGNAKYFRWKFHYDKLSDIIRAYAEDVTEEENLRKENAQITIKALTQMAKVEEAISDDIGPHIEIVQKISISFVEKLIQEGHEFYFSPEEFGHAVILHDIGKVSIPADILDKPGYLNPEERDIINLHTVMGEEIIEEISDNNMYKIAMNIAYYHHQWWDGNETKSYPEPGSEINREKIPVEARIVAIVDVFDALLAKRCYKPEMKPDDVIKELNAEKGAHFDPELFDIFIKNIGKFIAERNSIILKHEEDNKEDKCKEKRKESRKKIAEHKEIKRNKRILEIKEEEEKLKQKKQKEVAMDSRKDEITHIVDKDENVSLKDGEN